MGKCVVSVLFENRLGVSQEEYKSIMSAEAVINMSGEDVIRLSDLRNPEEIYWMLKVYASGKFNYTGEDEEYYRFTDEEKAKTINTIYSANGGQQFINACKSFCALNVAYLNGNHERAIEIVDVVAKASKGCQAKWGSAVASIDFISGCSRVIDILKFITSLEDEDIMSQAYNELASLETIDFEEGMTFKEKIDQIINKYRQKQNVKIPRGMSNMFPPEDQAFPFDEESCTYTPRQLIKVKSIGTLQNTKGTRRKGER